MKGSNNDSAAYIMDEAEAKRVFASALVCDSAYRSCRVVAKGILGKAWNEGREIVK